VGCYGAQIAKEFNAHVTGVDSSVKLDAMKEMGFDQVIDYTKEDFTKNGVQYDLILDAKTNRSPFTYTRSLKPGGIYATVGGNIGRLMQTFFFGKLIKLTHKKHVRVVALKANKDLGYMNDLFAAGKLKSFIHSYKFEDFDKAFDLYGKAAHKGKVVLTLA
jgi:NADPH:quinone reductase-like Zn-dependent oxidoreductase